MVSAVMLSNAKQLYRVLLSRLSGVKEGTFFAYLLSAKFSCAHCV